MRRTLIVLAALLVPAAASAAPTSSTVDFIRYGLNANRVSVALTTPHPSACGGGDTPFYTFTGKPLWAQAFLEALENGLTVSVQGKGTCTLGVEEIAFFDVENSGVAAKKRAK